MGGFKEKYPLEIL